MTGAALRDMSVGDALRVGRERLYPSRTAGLDADLLLGHVLSRRREWLLAHDDASIAPAELQAYLHLLERRALGEPIAYLRGWIEWYGRRFAVSEDVLVPRPETEILLQQAVRLAQVADARVAADVGTGSSVLAVGLAINLPNLRVTAVEKEAAALAVAAQNIAAHELGHRVTLLEGNLLEPVTERPDLVVANLPYLSDEMMAELDRDVRHEPAAALHAGGLGIEVYAALTEQMALRGWRLPLAIEVDPRQVEWCLDMLARRLGPGRVEIIPDLAGHDRVVTFSP